MSADQQSGFDVCNCHAIRQAARHVTQFYDQQLAPSGLRVTQFAMLSRLHRSGAMTINELAAALVMDRTTLGRNILPLQRDGLIAVAPGPADRRRHELHITQVGIARYRAARQHWGEAQRQFGAVFGDERAAALRGLLREVVASDFAMAE